MTTPTQPFAKFGSEKMIYDARMGPVAVDDGQRVVIVYQGGEGASVGQPHIIAYDRKTVRWSPPMQLGTVSHRDHHFMPIVWRDDGGYWQVLYHCHFSPGVHLVSKVPDAIDAWENGETIADSISYPSIHYLGDGRRLLFYRVKGHLGYWVYRLSDDGGRSWGAERLLIDFDYDPQDEADRWAGSYPLPLVSRDGRSLHIGLCYWDERNGCHPRYRFKLDLLTRYHLYYLKLDVDSGELSTIHGTGLDIPVNRRAAEAAKVLDSGDELTNFPTIATDAHDRPMMIVPISEGDPWRCRFHCLRWDGSKWQHSTIIETDNTWSASRVIDWQGDRITADLIVGEGKGEACFYGGGQLQRWQSDDNGLNWRYQRSFVPIEGLIYNNPRPVERAGGGVVDDAFVLYGWQGPGGVWKTPSYDTPNHNRGMAWLWLDGKWA